MLHHIALRSTFYYMCLQKTSIFFLLLAAFVACKDNERSPHKSEDLLTARNPVGLSFPNQKGAFRWGDSIKIAALSLDTLLSAKKSEIWWGDSLWYASDSFPFNITISSTALPVGEQTFTLRVWDADNKQHSVAGSVLILSDIEPDLLTFKVINIVPHSTDAYTQGLEFDGNTLIEGTGLEGKSILQTVDFFSGKVIKQVALPQAYFGEGITMLNNKIYQLTWQNGICLVYERATLEKINEFSYSGEGWGLTNYKGMLVRSDGSNKLFFHSPEDFKLQKTLQVYDNKRAIHQLNELEMVGDVLYANIYTKDIIAKIDIRTGKVLAYINMSGLLPEVEENDNTDVLNGIAWHPIEKRLYVTGKNWPKMYAIKEVADPKVQ